MSSTTLSPVKLQPPGAGLPTSELAYLRIVFRFACIVTSQNAAMWRFKLERDKIVSLARSVAAIQGTVRVLINRIAGIEDSSRYGSVFMVLDHLRIVDEGITRIVEELTNDRPFAREVRIQDVKPSIDAGPNVVDSLNQSLPTRQPSIDSAGWVDVFAIHTPGLVL